MKRRTEHPPRLASAMPQPQVTAQADTAPTQEKSREEEALLGKIQRLRTRIEGCKEDGVSTQGLEESLRKLLKEVPPPITALSIAVTARDQASRKCQIHKAMAEAQERFAKTDASAKVELTKMRDARTAQVTQLEEDYKTRLNSMKLQFEALEAKLEKETLDAREKHEERVKHQQSQLDGLQAAELRQSSEALDEKEKDTGHVPPEEKDAETQREEQHTLWCRSLDARSRADLELFKAKQIERRREEELAPDDMHLDDDKIGRPREGGLEDQPPNKKPATGETAQAALGS
jgi:hypothetical protein